ncbi:MAG: aminopeptidase P family protein [Candidatus Abyssobacteria bacterium SURF_5]|uniref:Aminopeptidase P family protein n=1 Tax=Abyssobacteria bacterium (strain SURF_5) TaxID=2093360 RepID=A0A3A4NDM0_ABYX5|nr:MAG: aminopeptidase P family protein [Candidatus Abyssubacteria bacterium SURF_5]
MNIYIDYPARMERIRREMAVEGVDILLATREKSVCYISGAFVPWRSYALMSSDGRIEVNTLLMDFERVKAESWLGDRVVGSGPVLPGFSLIEQAVARIQSWGYAEKTIGVELGHSPRLAAGFLFATEYEMLLKDLPKATFVNAINVVDKVSATKETGEIALMKRAAAICDAAQEAVRNELRPGLTELEIAGIGELTMRQLGSEFHWPITGSNEIASGERTAYAQCGCTPPTDRIVQPGDNVLVDLHSTYGHYYSDLSHNYIIGKPTREQERLAEAYTGAAEFLISKLVPGARVPDIWQEMMDYLSSAGYVQDALAAFGHGIGIVGHEWYPAITSGEEFSHIVLEPNLTEVAALVINRPGVGGHRLECPVLITQSGNEVLTKTPIRPTIIA